LEKRLEDRAAGCGVSMHLRARGILGGYPVKRVCGLIGVTGAKPWVRDTRCDRSITPTATCHAGPATERPNAAVQITLIALLVRFWRMERRPSITFPTILAAVLPSTVRQPFTGYFCHKM
jgi:hypothetical protein